MKTVTIDNLADSTAQEVFDFIVSSLLKQGEKSRFVDGVCAMRGENDTCCAAGFLIPDDKYSKDMELLPWGDVVARNKISTNHMSLISNLQTVHDDASVTWWKSEFIELAARYELNTEVLS